MSAPAAAPIEDPEVERPPDAPPPRPGRALPWVAALLGVLSVLLAAATPFLPVEGERVTVSWPARGELDPVITPLVAGQPLSLTASVPCAAARTLDARSPRPALVLGTESPDDEPGAGLVVQVDGGELIVATRGAPVASATLPLVPDPDCAVRVTSDATATTVDVDGSAAGRTDGDVRPQVVGVFTALDSDLDRTDGTALTLEVDDRYDTGPGALKTAATVGAVIALVGSLVALHRLDARDARHRPRRLRRLRPKASTLAADVAVLAVLGTWYVIGTITVDDGYLLTMARAREDAGYLGNYYRWFNAPEAPFGWTTELFAALVPFGTTTLEMRVPALVLGITTWLLLSRGLLPRLGPAARRAGPRWAAATVFLCAWLPFGNGLRPEPFVALGALAALVAVERAVALRRLLPVAVGLLAAGLTITASPTGVIALVPFVVASRSLAAIVRERATGPDGVRRWTRALPLAPPVLAAGAAALLVAFADQSWATVVEATRVRSEIGPSLSWYEEPIRYWQLLDEGSVARRFPVLVLLVCAGVCALVAVRRGRVPGAAAGPSARLVATAVGSLAAFTLTPTKWTHHFGAFAALTAAVAALAAVAVAPGRLRARRNRALVTAALLVVAALAAAGPNQWPYASSFGVPWSDVAPVVGGVRVSSILLALAGVALVAAAVGHVRDRDGAPRGRLARSLPPALPVLCGAVALAEVAVLVAGMVEQRGSYSVGAAAVRDGGCGLADDVLVEASAGAGGLRALPASREVVTGGLRRLPPPPDFTVFEPGLRRPAELPDSADLWSSYSLDGFRTTGTATTPWFALPPRLADGTAPLVLPVAGWLDGGTALRAEFAEDTAAPRVAASLDLTDDLAGPSPASASPPEASADPESTNATFATRRPEWRDLRLVAGEDVPAGAAAVRLVAEDLDVRPDTAFGRGWIAFAAPRVPLLRTLTDVVDDDEPVLVEWPVSFVFPCLRQAQVRDGVAEVPQYWIAGPDELQPASRGWSAATAGGPLGWLTRVAEATAVPTYLRGAWRTDWGTLLRVDPDVDPDVDRTGGGAATVSREGTSRWGWESDGPALLPDPDTERP